MTLAAVGLRQVRRATAVRVAGAGLAWAGLACATTGLVLTAFALLGAFVSAS
jgi:hypothetical protein